MRVLRPAASSSSSSTCSHLHRLADAQIKFTPFQVQAADGCTSTGSPLQNIKAAAFKSVDSEYFDLDVTST